MKDSFYFLYLDEIYTPNLNEFIRVKRKEISQRSTHHHFGLVGVIIPSCKMIDLNFQCRNIQIKFYPRAKDPILHYVDILHNRELYSDLELNKQKRADLINTLNAFVKKIEFNVIFSFINKEKLILKYGRFIKKEIVGISKIKGNMFPYLPIKNYNLYVLSLKFLLMKFFEFLIRKQGRGVIIAESRGGAEDTELREAFDAIHRQGISNINIRDFRQVVLDIFIINKKQNHAGLQLSDLILYPTYDATIPDHNIRNDHFIGFDKVIKKKLYKGMNSISVFP